MGRANVSGLGRVLDWTLTGQLYFFPGCLSTGSHWVFTQWTECWVLHEILHQGLQMSQSIFSGTILAISRRKLLIRTERCFVSPHA